MNKNFQSPLQVLTAKSKAGWSGCIEIEEPNDASISWNVYLLQGKIQYVSSALGQQERIDYLWQRYKLGSHPPQFDQNETSEYIQLCESFSNKQLSEVNIKRLLYKFCQEGLANLLSIDKTNIQLVPARRIKKSIISFSLDKLREKLEERIEMNKHIRGYIANPFSRLYLNRENALKFYQVWKPKYASPELESIAKNHKLSTFVSLFVAKNTLYQIATKTNSDLYFISKHLKHSISEKLISILPFKELTPEEIRFKNQSNENKQAQQNPNSASVATKNRNSSTLIVCIDDSKTVQRQVKMTLEAGGYQVMSILDPTTALKQLSQRKPTVIFMDINMPNLNGYDLCSLLRKSQRFKDIPIVMLTGRDGMIDRVRAKIVGATDYLTKPCDPNKLISLTKALETSTVTVS